MSTSFPKRSVTNFQQFYWLSKNPIHYDCWQIDMLISLHHLSTVVSYSLKRLLFSYIQVSSILYFTSKGRMVLMFKFLIPSCLYFSVTLIVPNYPSFMLVFYSWHYFASRDRIFKSLGTSRPIFRFGKRLFRYFWAIWEQ